MAVTLKTMVTDWLRVKTQSGTPATPASGYTVIYEEGGSLKIKTSAGTVTTLGAAAVDDTAYDATSWNGVTTTAPSKNAVRDKFESLSSGAYPYILLRDQKTNKTDGGSLTTNTWTTRVINTEVADTGNHCSISANQITLDAGTYVFHIITSGYATNGTRARLYNITDSALVDQEGLPFGNAAGVNVHVKGYFTIATSKTFEVQMIAQTGQATYGQGLTISNYTSNDTGAEVYTAVEFWKVA